MRTMDLSLICLFVLMKLAKIISEHDLAKNPKLVSIAEISACAHRSPHVSCLFSSDLATAATVKEVA